ncbi:nitrate- and nitrite sensing domain-containing protein [Curvibacter sp. HBC61]|uniref:Nitrate- and nitrite sensing domain-containing protein n=1 Tax=Curvibacter cyanobacteriorum TaxID=3026422 RepID=A0ABT5N0T6_9BURK|nr:nitrate- and nitrite sensing domain-containing protein [Curvibacter sp. HBC61]MDD0839929.1 nitrate- and nitrite sensing domain-containing protein [Curvibacter sp. HBC61]
MPLSVSQLVLRAKQLEIEALRHLAGRVDLVDVTGQLIDALQRERGASSGFLASGGQRFVAERRAASAAAEPVEAALREQFAHHLQPPLGASTRLLSLMAWVLLDLEALPALRAQIERQTPSASDAVAAFSRVIAGLVELIFHLADAAPNPDVSRLLVAFVHLVQGKEAAGQERAVGAQLYASGLCTEALQQRVVQLIEAQERSLHLFEEFAEPALRTRWQQLQLTPKVALLERLRRTLCMARHEAALDSSLSDDWFEVASVRIAELWQLQTELVACLRQACQAQMAAAERDLQDSEGLLRQLRDKPLPRAHAVERFLQTGETLPAAGLGEAGLAAASGASAAAVAASSAAQAQEPSVSSLVELLQAQSERLARMEVELDTARRALNERKVIERAKGALMARLGLTEDAALRALQKASMDHNRRLLDVAEATLALPDFVFEGRGAGK